MNKVVLQQPVRSRPLERDELFQPGTVFLVGENKKPMMLIRLARDAFSLVPLEGEQGFQDYHPYIEPLGSQQGVNPRRLSFCPSAEVLESPLALLPEVE